METNPKLVCLVEDDPLIIRLYERVFKLHGYDIKMAKDGEEAIKLFDELTVRPSVILLDIMMPKLSGFDVLEIMQKKENLKGIPVLMLTNLASKEDEARALKMGAAMYIIKSQHTPKQLIAIIEEYIAAHPQ